MDAEDEIGQSEEDSLVYNEFPRDVSSSERKDSFIRTQPKNNELVFKDVNMALKVKIKGKKQMKHILSQCSGIMSCGLNAILGPTGSGKTSLLDVLAGRKPRSEYSGSVLVNGSHQTRDFRLTSGFVVQEDIVMGTMTVRENLAFSATLRLPKHYSEKDREKRVDQTIADLGLFNCAETRVGTDESRGISGGERRRTSIGMELITSPEFLFLDEPTTGLDASTACSVMTLLKKQCEKGRTIIFSIHQPRYSVFKQFDTTTLLSQGDIIYHGDTKQAITYFNDLGYPCETYNNPADHFLDIISINEKEQRDAAFSHQTAPTFADYYKKSLQKGEVDKLTYPMLQEANERDRNKVDTSSRLSYNSSFFKQLFYVSRRTAINVIRDPRTFASQMFINVLLGLIVGAIYYKLDLGIDTGLRNRSGMFFLITTNMVFSNMSAVAVFLLERRIFRHESASGYYRCSSYFIAKVICDVIPLRLIPILVFAAISYFLTGLQEVVVKFFIFVLTLFLTSTAAASWCLAVSSSVSNLAIANVLVSLPFVLMMIFSGFLNNLTTPPIWLRWLKYISIFKYGFANLLINEIEDLTFTGTKNGTIEVETGKQFLDRSAIDPTMLWWNQLALGAFASVFLFLTYVQLRRMKKF